jgi:hypothetical protein
LFQLAAGGLIDGVINTFVTGSLNILNGLMGGARNQSNSAQLQFQNGFNFFSGDISSQLGLELSLFDIFNGPEADACKINLTQQAYSLGNETRE